jgi:ketosteroid isomerase-like protein
MTDEYNAISELLGEATAAFSGLDLKRFRSCYHLPCMVITPQGVASASSESEFDRLFRPMMESLKARGFARSEWAEKHVKLQSDSTATASVLWIRFRKDGAELERLGATYALYKSNRNWKIAMVMAHDPDSVLRLR